MHDEPVSRVHATVPPGYSHTRKTSVFFSAKGSNHTNDDKVHLVVVLGRKHQWNKPADEAGAVLGRRVLLYGSQHLKDEPFTNTSSTPSNIPVTPFARQLGLK